MILRWQVRVRNVTRAHSRDHAHYKSVHCFLICLKNQINDLVGLFFADSSSTGYSRGLRHQMATNERHIGVPPLQLYKNGNFNLAIILFLLQTLHIAPSRSGVSFNSTKNSSYSLHTIYIYRKLKNSTTAVSVIYCSRISRRGM